MQVTQLDSIPFLGAEPLSKCPAWSLVTSSLRTASWLLAWLTSFTEPAWYMGEEPPSSHKNFWGLRIFQWRIWQLAWGSISHQHGIRASKPWSWSHTASRSWAYLGTVCSMPRPPGNSVISLSRILHTTCLVAFFTFKTTAKNVDPSWITWRALKSY